MKRLRQKVTILVMICFCLSLLVSCGGNASQDGSAVSAASSENLMTETPEGSASEGTPEDDEQPAEPVRRLYQTAT